MTPLVEGPLVSPLDALKSFSATAITPVPLTLDMPDISGIPTGIGCCIGTPLVEDEKVSENGYGPLLKTDKVSPVDLTVILTGVTRGILNIIIHAELLVGTVVGGCIGSILAAAVTRPVSLVPSVLAALVALLVVIVGASATAGRTTVVLSKEARRDDTVEVTLVPPVVAPTVPLHLTLHGTVGGPTTHRTAKIRKGKVKEAYLTTRTAVVSPTSDPARTVTSQCRPIMDQFPRTNLLLHGTKVGSL